MIRRWCDEAGFSNGRSTHRLAGAICALVALVALAATAAADAPAATSSQSVAARPTAVLPAARTGPSEPPPALGEGLFGTSKVAIWALAGAVGILALLIALLITHAARQRRFEKALAESEQRYRRIVETTNEGVWTIDADARTDFVNTRMAELLGYTPAEMLGMHLFDSMDDAARGRAERLLAERRRGFSAEHEFIFRRKDGEPLHAVLSTTPFMDDAGRFAGALAMVTDITRRKHAEGRLRGNEARLTALIENTDGSIWSVDREYRLIAANSAFRRNIAAACGQPFQTGDNTLPEALGAEALAEWRGYYDRALAGEQFSVELRRRFVDTSRFMEYRFNPIREDDGSVTGVTVYGRDVTERIGAERAARESELERSTILNTQPQAVILQDLDFRVVWPNDAACQAAGMSRRELIGKRCHEIWQKRDRPCDGCPVRLAMREGAPREAIAEGPEGRAWRVRGCPVRNDQGEIVRVVKIAEDITRQRQMEAQLREATKMEAVGHLAGGAAHDFRNQLQVIEGFGRMLLRRGEVTEEGREKMEQILAAADRSARLTGQLLAFSRREVLQPRVVEPTELVGDLRKSLPQLLGEDICVRFSLRYGAGPVRVDPGQFHQAVLNLCLNARDAMPDGGELTIETGPANLGQDSIPVGEDPRPGRYVGVSVADTGTGMDEETASKAFEPFFTTKEVGKGTGLGLSMVYGFVHQSDGMVTCDSRPGEGTTITMYFPAFRESAAGNGADATVPDNRTSGDSPSDGLPDGTRPTVLLVEDEEAVRRMLAEKLAEAGYAVRQAPDAEAALQQLGRHAGEIDVLVTDVVMPGMDGPALAKRAAELHPDLKVLYVSGYVGEELTRRGLDHLRDHVLAKPFGPARLLEHLERLLTPAE